MKALYCRWSGVILAVFVCLLIVGYSFWYASAGKFPDFPYVKNAYVDLGQSFLHGQLSLLEEPDPRLIALENPYDPFQRDMPYRWDASYYNGKYYLYWGPVPALGFAIAEITLADAPPGSIIALLSYVGIAVVMLVILLRLHAAFFPESPKFSPSLFLVLTLINLPFLFLIGRPDIYETSIIAGQFFLLLGILGWVLYLTGGGYMYLLLSGFGWGLAVGSRYNLIFSVAVFLGFIVIWLKSRLEPYRVRQELVFLLAPLILCIIGLGLYNFARFDNPMEFGYKYQLSIPEVQGGAYSISYILSNLYVYLFYPLTTLSSFPFILATLPVGKSFDEIVAGLFPSVPGAWLIFLALPFFVLGRKMLRDDRLCANREHLFNMFAFAALAQFLFLMIFFFAAMRYMADFYPVLVLTISMLIWQADEFLQKRRKARAAFWLLAVGLLLWTVGIGFFGAFDIPPQIFQISNPELYANLVIYWNNCTEKINFLVKS